MKRGKIFSRVFWVILLLTLVLGMASVVYAQFWTQDSGRDWRDLTPTKIVCESPLGYERPDCCGSYPELCVKNPSVSPYETNPEAKRAYEELLACYQENGYTSAACNLWPFQMSKELSPGLGQLKKDQDFCTDKCVTKPKESGSYDYTTEWENCRVPCLKSIGYTEHHWAFEEIGKAIDDAKSDYLNAPKKTTPDSGEESKQTEIVQEQETISPEQASSFSAEEDKNLADNQFFNQMKAALSEKESLSSEQVANAVKAYRAKINADQGKKISVDLPKGSSIQNIEAITARSLQDATMTVTVIDEVNLNKAVPLLGGKGIIGNPDYPIPRAPLGPPEVDKYLVKEYFSVENSMSADANPLVPFYEKTWFKFSLESSVEAAKNTVLLRYNKDANQWNPLPTQHILSVAPQGFYEFTSESPGTSYFAIVVEKEKSSSIAGWVIIAIVLIELAALIGTYTLLRRKTEKPGKKHGSEGKGVASLVLGILGILVFWFPPIGFPLAGLAIVFSRIQAAMKPTGLSIAGLVLGIIGVCLNAIILTFILFYSLSS